MIITLPKAAENRTRLTDLQKPHHQFGLKAKLVVGCLFLLLLTAADSDTLRDSWLTVETDEQSALESFERISGHYDLGRSSHEQSYRSSDHYAAGPFARQKSALGSEPD